MAYSKTLIFDLDGTLIHSAPDLQLAANAALAQIGRGPLDLATIISFIGEGVEPLVARILEKTGGADETVQRAVLAHFLEVYADNVTAFTRPYAGVVSALKHFRAQGMRLGICTNKPTEPARDICDRLDLTQYFDVIKGAETGQPKKPDPAPLFATIKAMGGSFNDALYVGDSAIDYHTARNASVGFRLFTGGYLNSPLPDLDASARFDDWANHGIHIW